MIGKREFQGLAIGKNFIALDDMKLIAMRGPVAVYERFAVEADGVDNKHVTLIVTDRLAIPRWPVPVRMLLVHVDSANVVIARVNDVDDVLGLHEIARACPQHRSHAARPAIALRPKWILALDGRFSLFL